MVPLDVSVEEYKFFARSGIIVGVEDEPKADDFFTLMFGVDVFAKIVKKTNRYAHQKISRQHTPCSMARHH